MHKYITIPLIGAGVLIFGGLICNIHILTSLGWVLAMAVIFFIPKAGEQHGWFTSGNIANAYFLTGILMVTAGALGAGYVISHLGLQGVEQEIAKFSVLASSALPGGALCADAILGLDVEAKQRRITTGFALLWGGIFAAGIAVCTVLLKKEGDFHHVGFFLQALLASLVSCLGPFLGTWASSRVEKAHHSPTSRSVDFLALSGVVGIAASIVALYITKLVMPMLGWGSAAETFVDEIIPAYGAAVSACLLAKALEINRLPFEEEKWLLTVGAALTDNSKCLVESDGKGHRTLKLSANTDVGIQLDIQVSLSGPVRKRLIEGNGLVRTAISELATKYLERQFKQSPNATRHAIKEDILLGLDKLVSDRPNS